MFVHPDATRFLEIVADAPPLDTLSVERNRADVDAAAEISGPTTACERVYDTTIAGVPVRVYIPVEQDAAQPAFLWIHGGGWVTGSLDLADTAVRDIATAAGAIGISIDYRLAPEHPFPAGLEDCLAVARAVLSGQSGVNVIPEQVAIAGDSAGGNLSAVVAQELRAHTPALTHQVLVYPVTDAASTDTESYSTFADGYYLTRRNMQYFIDTYAGGADREDPRMSPLRNPDLTGLPPATFILASHDPLVDEGRDYAAALLEQGIPATVIEFAGQVHPFVYLAGVIEDGAVARRLIGSQIRASFDRA
ncbi:alpha/beta hydrolase [Corynebacterium nasicanis]|uniref:Alpha/beta hydrolase n=1 Tax=Corynebacterium nasicanis TaxID=1448267 RepID=A0ABW1Q8A3_9CORY